jgi:hypothetical protein
VIGLGIILAIVTLPSMFVFAVAFRRFRAALAAGAGIDDGLPAATVVGGPARWTEGRYAQRFARRVPTIQAGLVSFAIASIAFMILSVIAMACIALAS